MTAKQQKYKFFLTLSNQTFHSVKAKKYVVEHFPNNIQFVKTLTL